MDREKPEEQPRDNTGRRGLLHYPLTDAEIFDMLYGPRGRSILEVIEEFERLLPPEE